MHFLPRINLLTLRCFVAAVRLLFPVNRQKKRKPRKQRNTEPWWELNQNTAALKSVLRARQLNLRYFKLNLKFLSVIVSLFLLVLFFPFMEIFATSSYSLIWCLGVGFWTGSKDEHSKNKRYKLLLKPNVFIIKLAFAWALCAWLYSIPFLSLIF